MTTWAAMHLLAAASGLVVISLALSRGDGSPLRRPLALLAANQFAWNAFAFGAELTHLETYALLGAVAAPLWPPVAFHFVLTFVGRRRQLRSVLWAAYALFATQALLPAVEVLVPGVQFASGLKLFALLLLGTSLPVAITALLLVFKHLRRATSELERLRARLLLFALVAVIGLLSTDPLADLDLPLPRLGTLGAFTFNVLLTYLTLGLGLFKPSESGRLGLGLAVVVGLFSAAMAMAVFSAFQARVTVLLTTLTTVCLVLAVLGWLFVTSSAAARSGLERFASLGRFSAQMAHDLKNPLAAAKGAAEYLTEELRRGGGGPNQEFAQLVVEQLDRLHSVIERYQRLSKIEPQLADLDANQLVSKVLALQHFAGGTAVTITTTLASPAPHFPGDVDLIASALENLVKNGLEAMPQGGTLTVSTSLTTDDDLPRVMLMVTDTGTGLDARAREQAFQPFFTTKATGSGLGLAFVSEIARAHLGEVVLTSREGMGTTVTLLFPTSAR